jgi:CBS domain-containing protein
MTVEQLIGSRAEIYSIRDTTTVHEAARYLRDRKVRSVGVTDEEGRLIGVVSQSDISDKVAAENKCPAWMHVSEIMSTNLVLVSPERTIDQCLHLMNTHGLYHLLVVGSDGRFRGMLSVTDLVTVMASDEKARADLLEAFAFDRV